MPPESPDLTVCIYSTDGYEAIQYALGGLVNQTVASSIEVLVFAPDASAVEIPSDVADAFFSIQVVSVGEDNIFRARYLAVQMAMSPIYFNLEDHVLLTPRWAEKIINAHEEWDVVGSAMANPAPSLLGHADFLSWFGAWSHPAVSAEMSSLPGHNTSYKVALLRTYGEDLFDKLVSEQPFHYELRTNGERLYLASEALLNHLNISKLGTFIAHAFDGGRLYSSYRSKQWNIAKKFVYLLATPVVILLKVARIASGIFRRRTWRDILAMPGVFLSTTVHTMGEAVGYVAGLGVTAERYRAYESNRFRQMSRRDLLAIADRPGN